MNDRPSFLREVIGAAWLMVKVLIPVAAWIALVVWVARKNVIAMSCVLYGGILLGMILFFAYWNYKWKRSFAGEGRSGETLRKTQVSRQAPTRMPLDYLQPEARRLPDLPPREEAYIYYTEVLVDLGGGTWVERNARIYEQGGPSVLKVQLVENEGYVLTIPKRENSPLRFTPRRISSFDSYAPIVRILEVPE